jgi:hypothetical protein
MTPLMIIIGCLLFDILQLAFWIESMQTAATSDSKRNGKHERIRAENDDKAA